MYERTRELAVIIRVIAAEQHPTLVTVDDDVVRSNSFESRPIAEVLAIDFTIGTPTIDVGHGMRCQHHSVIESSLDEALLSDVAARVDGVQVDCASIPWCNLSCLKSTKLPALKCYRTSWSRCHTSDSEEHDGCESERHLECRTGTFHEK